MKKGFAVSFWAVTIGIASTIIGIFILGAAMGNFWSTIGQSENVQSTVSATRLSQAAELVSYVPSSGYNVEMDREYESIEIGDGIISFFDGEEPLEVKFFSGVDADFDEVSNICVSNEGSLGLNKGSCSISTCESPLCMEWNGYGIVCREGVLETNDYHRNVFEQCRTPEGNFFNLDYVQCPERAEPGAIMSCSASMTYRCRDGERTLNTELGESSEQHELECTGSIENKRVLVTTAASADGQVFRLDFEEEDVSTNVEVRPG